MQGWRIWLVELSVQVKKARAEDGSAASERVGVVRRSRRGDGGGRGCW